MCQAVPLMPPPCGHRCGLKGGHVAVVLSKFKRFFVIIFFWKDRPQSEGSRHADHGVKLLPGRLTLTLSRPRRFVLLSSRHYRLKTFAKRTFPRCRALLSGRDVTRVRHDAMGVASWRAGCSLPLRYRNGLSGRERRLIKPPRPV